MTSCSICESHEFKEGYGGRLSTTGLKPTCVKCGSVERHRIIYSMYEVLVPFTKNLKALQFAPDNTLRKENFATLEGSTYGGENSLDMMNTGLTEGSYDLILSNHVLEHVRDHTKAIQEMIRVVGPTGLVHVCVPSPASNLRTVDWGFPDPKKTFHYRWYGADAGMILAKNHSNLHVMAAIGRDPVTDTYDIVFWLSRSEAVLNTIARQLLSATYVVLFLS